MSRIPVEGKTKTRLMNFLTGEQCAELQRCFLKDIFSTCEQLKAQMDIYLTYTAEDGPYEVIEDIVPEYIEAFTQWGRTLGNRMANAIKYVKDKGYKKVLLMGTDIPHVKKEDIYYAIKALDTTDICLGPTYDGGYYIVGMKNFHEEIFEDNIKWGNKTVLEGTMHKINSLGLTCGLGVKLYDIDTKEDLMLFFEEFYLKTSDLSLYPENTLMFLKEMNVNELAKASSKNK
jgi:rSAM/selenodomain-associated transferase 1